MAVRDVVAYMVDVIAQQSGMNAEEAVYLVTSETVADAIAKASDQTLEGAEAVHAVRPVRVDARTVSAAARVLGRLVMAAAQAGGDDSMQPTVFTGTAGRLAKAAIVGGVMSSLR